MDRVKAVVSAWVRNQIQQHGMDQWPEDVRCDNIHELTPLQTAVTVRQVVGTKGETAPRRMFVVQVKEVL